MPDPTPTEVAEMLENLAERTGNSAFERAARAIWQQPSGRPPINDGLAVAEVRQLLASGAAKTLNQALAIVAKALGPIGHEKATAERLRRKWLKINFHEII